MPKNRYHFSIPIVDRSCDTTRVQLARLRCPLLRNRSGNHYTTIWQQRVLVPNLPVEQLTGFRPVLQELRRPSTNHRSRRNNRRQVLVRPSKVVVKMNFSERPRRDRRPSDRGSRNQRAGELSDGWSTHYAPHVRIGQRSTRTRSPSWFVKDVSNTKRIAGPKASFLSSREMRVVFPPNTSLAHTVVR